MENKVIKFVSMIPKEGFEQKVISKPRYRFEGLNPGYVKAEELNGSKPLQEVEFMAIQAKYKIKYADKYEDWNTFEQKIEQSNLVDLPPNAYLEFAQCYESHKEFPDTHGTLAWNFTKKYGVLGSSGAGLHGHETLYQKRTMASFDYIGIDRFMEEAKSMYDAMISTSQGQISKLKYLIEEGKDVGVQVAVEKYKGKFQVVYLPNNLASALWLQFFNAISSERVSTHAVCLWTGRLFQQSRSDQKFSTASAKAAYNRKYPQGKTKPKAKLRSVKKTKGGKK